MKKNNAFGVGDTDIEHFGATKSAQVKNELFLLSSALNTRFTYEKFTALRLMETRDVVNMIASLHCQLPLCLSVNCYHTFIEKISLK